VYLKGRHNGYMNKCKTNFFIRLFVHLIKVKVSYLLAKVKKDSYFKELDFSHSRSSRCPGTTKILNAFNYFYVLNAAVNLLRGN